mgnify:CR=1 FL=1
MVINVQKNAKREYRILLSIECMFKWVTPLGRVRFYFAKRNIADSFFTKEPAMFYFLCIHIGVDGILFNKLTTRTYVITHQHREYVVGIGCIFE